MIVSKAILKFANGIDHIDTSSFLEIRSKDLKNSFSYDTISASPSNLLLVSNIHGYHIAGPQEAPKIGGSQEISLPDHEQRQLYVDFPNFPGGMYQLTLTFQERLLTNIPATQIENLIVVAQIIEN
jgi:hypothetical protein